MSGDRDPIPFWDIKTLCEEYMCQSAEMLGELDEPPPRFIKKRDLLSAAWTSIAAGSPLDDGAP